MHSLKRRSALSWTACSAAICGPVPVAGGTRRAGATCRVYMWCGETWAKSASLMSSPMWPVSPFAIDAHGTFAAFLCI